MLKFETERNKKSEDFSGSNVRISMIDAPQIKGPAAKSRAVGASLIEPSFKAKKPVGKKAAPINSLAGHMSNPDLAIALVHLDNATGAMSIIDVNEKFEADFAYKRKQVLGKNLLTFLQNKKAKPQTLNPAANHNGTEAAKPFEMNIKPYRPGKNSTQTKNGGNFICTLKRSVQPEADTNNMISHRILSSMSHDLRTPLNGILGFSEIMMTEMLGPLGTESYRGYARDIHGAGQELLRAIDGLLNTTSAINGGLKPLYKTDLPISDCMAAALLDNSGNIRLKKLEIQQQCDKALPLASLDREQFTDALSRLFSAAIKRSPVKGKIKISITKLPENALQITCEDEGPRLSAEKLDRIFAPFPMISDNYTTDGSDLGQGFYLVRQIIEQHGGSVTLGNRKGNGLKYSVSLPMIATA